MKLMQHADRVSIRAKLTIFAVVVLIAIAIPAYYLHQQATENVELASLSIKGVPLAQQTVILRKLIAQHRGTSARFLGGDDSARTPLVSFSTEVDAVFRQLLSDLENDAEGAIARSLLQQNYATWNGLKDASINKSDLGTVIFNRHSQLIVDLGEVAASIMRNFKLIYAPSDSAYHLVIANFNALPSLTDNLGKIRGMGAGVLAAGVLPPDTRARLEGLKNNARSANLEFLRNLRYVADTSNDPKLKTLIDDANDFNLALSQTMTMVQDSVLESESLDFPSSEFFNGVTQKINSLYEKQSGYILSLEGLLVEYSQQVQQQRVNKWLMIGVLLLIAGAVFLIVNLSINRGISSISKALKKLTAKDYDIRFSYKRRDEIGVIQKNVEALTVALKEFSLLSIEAIRVRQALDKSSSCFMMADNDRNIIYMNDSIQQLFADAESDLQKVLPTFNAAALMGGNIDVFHKNPSHQANLLSGLESQFESQIEVGGRYFRLIASPIKSDTGERLGASIEWLDRTKEVLSEQEIATLVDGAVSGDFTVRANAEGKTGFHLNLVNGLNQLMDVTESGLQEITNILMAIANRDLTQRISTDFAGTFGEMKNYCNETSDNLASVIGEIREASETIISGSGEIATGNADLSSRTEQQAANLEETASSMEQITSTVQLNAKNAKQANELASDAAKVALDGGQLIEKVVDTMSEINASATKIADIIGVIDGIAFQTNILALNAAVEAARAGEQGRGFAVVASEVRTLAQRSANAAKDIKELIADSVSKVESGNKLVSQSGDTMHNIVDAITHVNDIMAEIASASSQQASGIEAINEAIVQMDEMTQQNAALVEEAAAAAESMNTQAEQLGNRVQSFIVDDVYVSQFKKQPVLEHKQSGVSSNRKIVERDLPNQSLEDDDEWESF